MISEMSNISSLYNNKNFIYKASIAFIFSASFILYAFKDFNYSLFLSALKGANYYYIISSRTF